MSKLPSIQVVYESSDKPIIQIQLTPTSARAFLLGNAKIVDGMVCKIETALEFISSKEKG